jgi:hypothetical protein
MNQNHHPIPNFRRTAVIAGAVIGCSVLGGGSAWAHTCTGTAEDVRKSCDSQALSDYWLALAKCRNLPTEKERSACKKAAAQALREAQEECADQQEARLELCEDLGEAPYNPIINPTNFVAGVNHRFFPLVPGTTRIYEKNTDEGRERTEVTVTKDTKRILGVRCIVVQDTVTVDGEVVEDTFDHFAQDKQGNVWYFGELSLSFEDGELVDLHGSWEAGVDGAKPGIVMKAEPRVGDIYRQEFLLGEAEDVAEVIALNRSVKVPFGSFKGCLQTEDFTPLEPDVLENKFYAPGIGVILEVDVETGEQSKLIAVRKD